MKLASHSNKLETNAEIESQNFGIGDASVVIEILRNRLYEHKIRTLTQEYICNARDAMREIGKTAGQIQVKVPTSFDPTFTVRDFGPGISPDRMGSVFVLYGSSTKRSSNNQTGGFGIGAKSAWSYTDSFTIITHIDGVCRTYVAHTGVNNNGRLDLISTGKTQEANGTEIQIAVKPNDVREFRDAILRAVYFWDERPALKGLTDQSEFERFKGLAISQNLEVVADGALPVSLRNEIDSHSDLGFAVIDGVPYPLHGKLLDKIKTFETVRQTIRGKVLIFLGNGVLEVSASRESIADSAVTQAALTKIGAKLSLEVKTHIANQFGAIKNVKEFLKVYSEFSGLLDISSFANYNRYQINHNGYLVNKEIFNGLTIFDTHSLDRRGHLRKDGKVIKEEMKMDHKYIKPHLFDRLYFIDGSESVVVQNKRLREIMPNGRIILLDKTKCFDASWAEFVKEFKPINLRTVAYTELPKVAKAKIKREDTEFCIHQMGSYKTHHYLKSSENKQKWLYIPIVKGIWSGHDDKDNLKELSEFLRDHTEYRLCGVATEALKMVTPDSNFELLDDWLANFKPEQKILTAVKHSEGKNHEVLSSLSKINGIKDRFLKHMISEYGDFKTIRQKDIRVAKIVQERIKLTKEFKHFIVKDKQLGKLLKEVYPLMATIKNAYSLDQDIVHYLNAKHSKRGSKNV